MKRTSSAASDSTPESPFPTSFGYKPWILQSQGKRKQHLKLIDPFDGNIKLTRVPEMEGKICLGLFAGEWLLLLDARSNEIFFLNLTNLSKKVHLPPMSESFMSLGGCVVSASPMTPKCRVIFVGKNNNFVLCCRPNHQKWTKTTYEFFRFSGDVAFSRGYMYALLLNRCTVFTNVESLLGIADWTTIQYPQFSPQIRYYSQVYLLVSGDDIFLISISIYRQLVSGIKVFSLQNVHTKKTIWRNVSSIERRTFFLGGHNNMSFTMNDEQRQHNCIYLLQSDMKGAFLYKISLDDRSVCLRLILDDTTKELSTVRWIIPSRKRNIKWKTSKSSSVISPDQFHKNKPQEAALMNGSGRKHSDKKLKQKLEYDNCETVVITSDSRVLENSNARTKCCTFLTISFSSLNISQSAALDFYKEEEKNGPDQPRAWTDMPTELMELLFSKLSLLDCIYLNSTCKAWHSLPICFGEAKIWPWLMYFTDGCKKCKLIDPIYGREHVMEMDWLDIDEKLIPRYSKDGWVIVSTESRSLFMINPFKKTVRKLPCEYYYGEDVTFFSVPASPDFKLFRKGTLSILTSDGTNNWRNEAGYYPNGCAFNNFSNPVFFQGEFYCLGSMGELAIFYPESLTWKTLDTPAGIHSDFVHGYRQKQKYFLMETEGELFSVFNGINGLQDQIRVFKLDVSEWIWNKVQHLGGLTVFLGRRNGIAKRFPFEGCANRIYLPRFDDNSKLGAYYSLETHSYEPKLFNMTRPFQYVWVEPNFANF